MRMAQYRGLNDWARKTVLRKEKAFQVGVNMFEDGRVKPYRRYASIPVARIQIIGTVYAPGYDVHLAELRRFSMPDGKVYEEYVQAVIHSGGPVHFTALKNAATGEPVAESLWSEHDLNYC